MSNASVKVSEESVRQFIKNSLSTVKDKAMLSFANIPIEQLPSEIIQSYLEEDISLNYNDDFSGTVHYIIADVLDLEVTRLLPNSIVIVKR